MKKALHLWGVSADNAGDNLLGNATKEWFADYIKDSCPQIQWASKSCRDIFKTEDIEYINNNFDYLVIGGGGLCLPDTAPNMLSAWQWNISVENLNSLKIPIYVVSIGYNLFYHQTVEMPYRDSNKIIEGRLELFKKHMELLISKADYFSVRHKGDIAQLSKILNPSSISKIKFQICPTVSYTQKRISTVDIASKAPKTWAIEIKEDREWRRFYNTSKSKVYNELYKFIVYMKESHNINVKYLMHETRNISLLRYLTDKGINPEIIKNCQAKEYDILNNFKNIDVLLCMAGHSQMIGHAAGCKIISLISHDKLKYFLEDINEYEIENYVDLNKDSIFSKLKNISTKILK